MKTKLVVVGGRATKREVVLELPARIGRHSEAALTVIHPTVSRNHCELVEVDGRVVLRDLGSTNGTFVDDQRITEVVLDPGGRFTIGPLTFTAEYEPVNGAAGHPTVAPELRFDAPAAAVTETLVQSAADDHLSLQDEDDLLLAPLDAAVEVEPAAPSDDLQFDWDSNDLPLDAVEDEADSAELSFNPPTAEEDSAVAEPVDDEADGFDLQLAPAADADDDLGFALEDAPEVAAPVQSPNDELLPLDESLSFEEPPAFPARLDESSRDMSANDLLLDDIPLAKSPLPAAEPSLPDAAAANDPLSLGEEDAFGWELTPAADDDLPGLDLAAPDSPIAESPITMPVEIEPAASVPVESDSALFELAEVDLPPLASDDEDLRFLLDDPESVPPISPEPDLSDELRISDEINLGDGAELALDDAEIANPVVESIEFELALEDEPLSLAPDADVADEFGIEPSVSEQPHSAQQPADQQSGESFASESPDLQLTDDDEFLLAEPAAEDLSLEPLDLHVADQPAVEEELALEPLQLPDSQDAESLEFQLEDDDLAPLAELRDDADDLLPLVANDDVAVEPVAESMAEPLELPASADEQSPLKLQDQGDQEFAIDLDLDDEPQEHSGFDLDNLEDVSPLGGSLKDVDSPDPLVPEELALEVPELEGLSLDGPASDDLSLEEPAPKTPQATNRQPLPTGPVEPWEMEIAEPIVTDASHLVDALPPIPADELDYLDFDEPSLPIESPAQPAAARPAEPRDSIQKSPPDSPAIQDADEEFFLDLDPVDRGSTTLDLPVEGDAASLDEVSGELGLDDFLDDSLDLPGESSIAMDFDEPAAEVADELTESAAAVPVAEQPTATDKKSAKLAAKAAKAAEKAEKKAAKKDDKKAKHSWWPFGGKKKAAAAESAPAASESVSAEPELTETVQFVESDSELALGDEADLDPIESLGLTSGELDNLDQLRAPQIVDNFDLDELEGDEKPLDLPSTSAELEEVAEIDFDESFDLDRPSLDEAQAAEFDSLPADDPLAGLEEKESLLLEEIEQGSASLDLGVAPDATESLHRSEPLDLSETVEFVPSDIVPLESPGDAATESTAEPAAKKGFRWWPFGRKGPKVPKPPKLKKEKVKKEKVKKDKKSKDKQGADAPAVAAVPEFEPAETATIGEIEELELSFDDDAAGLAPLSGEASQGFSEDEALDFLSDEAPAANSKQPAKSPGPAKQQPQTTGKPASELSDLDLDEFLKDM